MVRTASDGRKRWRDASPARSSMEWASGLGFALRARAFPLRFLLMLSSSSIAFLKRLLDAPAPSGFETAAARVWRTEAETFAETVTCDVAGNSMAEANPTGKVTIML